MGDGRVDVVVYGATGYTGRLVCTELERQGLAFVIGGRDEGKLRALSASLPSRPRHVVAGIEDARGLRELASLGRVLLSCAGPFVRMGKPVQDAAIAAGAHWLDITGEHQFLQQTFARDAEAREAGVALVNAVGMDVVPTDLAGALAAEGLPDVEWVRVAVSLKGGVTRGTAKSMMGLIGEGSIAELDGRRVSEPIAAEKWDAPFAPPLGTTRCVSAPIADVITMPRSTGARNVRVFGHVPGGPAVAKLAMGIAGSRPGRALLTRLTEHLPEGPSDRTRAAGGFSVVAEAVSGSGQKRVCWMTGPDPYGFTAVSAAQCVRFMVAPGFDKRGALTPSQAFGARPLVEALAPCGVRWGLK